MKRTLTIKKIDKMIGHSYKDTKIYSVSQTDSMYCIYVIRNGMYWKVYLSRTEYTIIHNPSFPGLPDYQIKLSTQLPVLNTDICNEYTTPLSEPEYLSHHILRFLENIGKALKTQSQMGFPLRRLGQSLIQHNQSCQS